MKTTISVITINRNDAEGLARTVRSLSVLRNRSDVEFIFVDGSSTDSSLEIAHTFYRPDEIVSEPDCGIYDAMNKGLYRASGDYLVWINAGDEFSGELSVLQSIENCNADILSFSVVFVGDGNPKREWEVRAEAGRLPQSFLPHQGTYFRRELVLRLGGYDDRWKIVADRHMMVRALRAGASFEYKPEIVAAYHHHGGISSRPEQYLEHIRLNYELGLLGFFGLAARHINYHAFVKKGSWFGQTWLWKARYSR